MLIQITKFQQENKRTRRLFTTQNKIVKQISSAKIKRSFEMKLRFIFL